MKGRPSPFGDALLTLSTAGVDFMVVGVGGANFYAIDPATAFVTQDLDVWLRPQVANLRAALAALASAGFRFEAGGEPFLDIDDDAILRNVIQMTSSLVARSSEEDRIDLMVAMHGFDFERELAGAIPFRIQDVSIRVASLETILEAKRLAGREKDLQFLEAFQARRDEFVPAKRRPPRTQQPTRGRPPK